MEKLQRYTEGAWGHIVSKSSRTARSCSSEFMRIEDKVVQSKRKAGQASCFFTREELAIFYRN